ncbi:hypothetical protein [Entomobacter blattae]|nr:hypothetical protein [Entomobacter blattae]
MMMEVLRQKTLVEESAHRGGEQLKFSILTLCGREEAEEEVGEGNEENREEGPKKRRKHSKAHNAMALTAPSETWQEEIKFYNPIALLLYLCNDKVRNRGKQCFYRLGSWRVMWIKTAHNKGFAYVHIDNECESYRAG